jgi:alpha-L-fucosidase 2
MSAYLRSFVLLLSVVVCNCAIAQVKNTTNMPEFFAKQDPIFTSLTDRWYDGPFVGNGLLGEVAYRENDHAIRFEISRTDVTEHRPGINPSLGRCRLPIGHFILKTAGTITAIKLRLDIWNAEISGNITTDKGTISLQSLVLATSDIIMIHAKNTEGEKEFSIQWSSEVSQSPFYISKKDTSVHYEPNPEPTITKQKTIHFCYQPLTVGGSYSTAWKQINTADQKTVLATIANAYPANNSNALAAETLNSAIAKGLATLINQHRAHWHRNYTASYISIPDSRLQSFWWLQQYKLLSATRVGAPAIDLMGPWYSNTPWPKYWWNLNTQLTYYPVFSSNRLDLAQPLTKMIDNHQQNLINNAPEAYRYNAAALGRSGPSDMTSAIKVIKGNNRTDNSQASLELGNLTWLLHVYYQSYEYSMDERLLKSIYPILTKSINYYLDIMEKGDDGKYHLPYTFSPEYPDGITRDANYDLALLRWGCKTLIGINSKLKYNDPLSGKWTDVLTNLVPYPVDERGLMIGKDASFEKTHRHYSHMLMIYPIYELNWDQPENRALITKSLKQWRDNDKGWRGFSYTGAASIYASMGKGTEADELLNTLMDKQIKPSTMYIEAGPVIESALSAATSINELLLQSWAGVIRVFPALPSSWKNAAFDNLRAKGAFLVSAVAQDGATKFIRIKSLAGAPCIVKMGWSSPVKAFGSRKFTVTDQKNGLIKLDIRKGEEVILYTGVKPGSFAITPVKDDNNNNYWGYHKEDWKN